MLNTSLTKLLNIRYPILQAPIGSAASAELVAAVSNCGGLGMLALSWKDLETTRLMIRETKRLTDKPFAVNLILQFDQEERIKICLEEKVPVMSFAWGDPSDYISLLKKNNIITCQTVGSSAEGELYAKRGVDFLIAQGWEAGGHILGQVATSVLIPAIINRVDLPVVAAGGIANGKGILAALALGADGVSLGTRFLMSDEALTHPVFKQMIINSQENDTIYSADLFNVGWENAPHRVLRNSTVIKWEEAGCPDEDNRPQKGEVIAYQKNSQSIVRYSDYFPLEGMTGDVEALALYAGQTAGLISEEKSVSAIMKDLLEEIKSAYTALEKYLI